MCKTSLWKDSRKLREAGSHATLATLVWRTSTRNKELGNKEQGTSTLASDRSAWKTNYTKALQEGEKILHITVDTRRERQKARALAPPTNSTYICGSCHRICQSRIGLESHLRKWLRKCTITNSR